MIDYINFVELQLCLCVHFVMLFVLKSAACMSFWVFFGFENLGFSCRCFWSNMPHLHSIIDYFQFALSKPLTGRFIICGSQPFSLFLAKFGLLAIYLDLKVFGFLL